MKKRALAFITIALILIFAFDSEAWVWQANYPYSPDASTVYDRFSWDGYNHLAITWNDTVYTVSAIQMDPNGIPNLYYWGDIYAYSYPVAMYLYYSYNGNSWYYAGVYYYY